MPQKMELRFLSGLGSQPKFQMGLNHILVDFASDTQDQHFWASNISSAVFLAFTTVNRFDNRHFVIF